MDLNHILIAFINMYRDAFGRTHGQCRSQFMCLKRLPIVIGVMDDLETALSSFDLGFPRFPALPVAAPTFLHCHDHWNYTRYEAKLDSMAFVDFFSSADGMQRSKNQSQLFLYICLVTVKCHCRKNLHLHLGGCHEIQTHQKQCRHCYITEFLYIPHIQPIKIAENKASPLQFPLRSGNLQYMDECTRR